jgi:ribosomal protein S18 acetylase RimI-like enzyme
MSIAGDGAIMTPSDLHNSHIVIAPLAPKPEVVRDLAGMLIEVVENGASVSFMHPLSAADATAFWESSLAAAARGERVVFGARDAGALVATVTLQLAMPANQPHRAEIAKMMTRPSHRGRGIASRLLQTAEARAVAEKRSLLVLDTAVEDGASGFYVRLGYTEAGVIPDYACKPHGGLSGTRLFWKRLGTAA